MIFIAILMCLLFKTCISIISADGALADLWNIKTLIANFGLVFSGYPYFEMMGINNPVWYICVLIQCYILYYLLEWILRKKMIGKNCYVRLVIYISVILLSMLYYHHGILNGATFRGFVSFSIGILLYIINEEVKSRGIINDSSRILVNLALFIAALLSCTVVGLGIDQREVLQFFVFPLLVWIMININFPRIDIISKLGDISFELYIIHYPLMVLLQLILSITGFLCDNSYFTMLLFLICSWYIAWLMWKFLDLPMRIRIKELEKKYE